jgi:hypothetical protein
MGERDAPLSHLVRGFIRPGNNPSNAIIISSDDDDNDSHRPPPLESRKRPNEDPNESPAKRTKQDPLLSLFEGGTQNAHVISVLASKCNWNGKQLTQRAANLVVAYQHAMQYRGGHDLHSPEAWDAYLSSLHSALQESQGKKMYAAKASDRAYILIRQAPIVGKGTKRSEDGKDDYRIPMSQEHWIRSLCFHHSRLSDYLNDLPTYIVDNLCLELCTREEHKYTPTKIFETGFRPSLAVHAIIKALNWALHAHAYQYFSGKAGVPVFGQALYDFLVTTYEKHRSHFGPYFREHSRDTKSWKWPTSANAFSLEVDNSITFHRFDPNPLTFPTGKAREAYDSLNDAVGKYRHHLTICERRGTEPLPFVPWLTHDEGVKMANDFATLFQAHQGVSMRLRA